MKKKIGDEAIIMCTPYPEFKEPPPDYSASELFDCPKCKGKMWLSQKKKGMLLFMACLNKNIVLGCFNCIKKHFKDHYENAAEFVEIKL